MFDIRAITYMKIRLFIGPDKIIEQCSTGHCLRILHSWQNAQLLPTICEFAARSFLSLTLP